MTEDEAKTKWCPQSRLGSSTSGLGGFNRFVSPAREADFEGTRCLGSGCMWWRWTFPPRNDPYPTPDADQSNGGRGYCGLAGRP